MAGSDSRAGAVKGATGPWQSSEEPQEVEESPNGRYIRYNVLLGKGACKRVYKALDTEEGTEVAWNQVDLLGLDRDEEQRQHLHEEIRVLQKLKHKNIMTFYAWWYDSKNSHINFITELFTAGNLRQYRKKLKIMSENVLKRWAHQILEGLLYLHGHVPPIVHRDLKCDNIFVNSATGEIKIGDLGLATVQQQAMSVVGTPEFMAPEVYDESYDERCDIYSFGMCLLELATQEYPYAECHSVPQIFKKVTLGVPPASLARVSSPELRDFISLCIAHDPADRPSARALLKHPYLESVRLNGALDGSGHSNGHGSLLASMGNIGSGTGTGWNTPSGTMHCAASARDLREALHQQEALARLAAAAQQQQQQQLQSHGQLQSHLSCPSGGPTSPTAAVAAVAAAPFGGSTSCSGAAGSTDSLPSMAAAAIARSRASFSGILGPNGVMGPTPPSGLLRSPSLAASASGLPPQPSPLSRTASPHSLGGDAFASALPQREPSSAGSAAASSAALVAAANAAASALLPPTLVPHRLPRSRFSGIGDVGSSSGGSLPASPMGRSQNPALPAPWAAGPASPSPPSEPAPQPLADAQPGPHAQCSLLQLPSPCGYTKPPSPGRRLSPPALQLPCQGQPCADGSHARDTPSSETQPDGSGRPWQRCDSCSGVSAAAGGRRTSSSSRRSSGYSQRSGGSDDSDDDEEVLVPIEVLKAGLLAEGFAEEECEGASPSFSCACRPGEDSLQTPRLPASSDDGRGPTAGAAAANRHESLPNGGQLMCTPSFSVSAGGCGQHCAEPNPCAARKEAGPTAAGLAAEASQARAGSSSLCSEPLEPSGPCYAGRLAASKEPSAALVGEVGLRVGGTAAGELARCSTGSVTGPEGDSSGSLGGLSFHAQRPLGASGSATPALRLSCNGSAMQEAPTGAPVGPSPSPPFCSPPLPGRSGPSGRPPLPPGSAPSPQAAHPPHVFRSPGTGDSGAAGAAAKSGLASGPVKLPSFRNKVVLTVASDGSATAAAGAPQTRFLRTTSARTISLTRSGEGPPALGLHARGVRTHAGWAGGRSFRNPRDFAADVAGDSFCRDAAMCRDPQLRPIERTGRSPSEGDDDAAGASSCREPPRYDRSMSTPLTALHGCSSSGGHTRCSSIDSESAAPEGVGGGGACACSVQAPEPNGSVDQGIAPPSPGPLRTEAGMRHPDTNGSYQAGFEPAVRDCLGTSADGLGACPLSHSLPLPPLQEDSGELRPPSPGRSDSSHGARVLACHEHSNLPPEVPLIGADHAGEVTVVREYARPIHGVIMRLKQWKRLVKDRAKALRA